jgi:hypothetical protein
MAFHWFHDLALFHRFHPILCAILCAGSSGEAACLRHGSASDHLIENAFLATAADGERDRSTSQSDAV